MLASVVGKIKLGNPEIDRPRSQARTDNKLSPDMATSRNQTQHWWKASVSPLSLLCFTKKIFFQIIIRNATFFFFTDDVTYYFYLRWGHAMEHSHVTTNTKLKTNSLPLLRSWKLVSQACLQITKNRWKHVENKHGWGVLKIPIHKSHYVSLFYLTQCSTS